MTDGNRHLNLYETLQRQPARRRWWEKQRFIIPIVVAVLAPAIWVVAGLVAGDGVAERSLAAVGERMVDPGGVDSAAAGASSASEPAAASGRSDGGDGGGDDAVVTSEPDGDQTTVASAQGERDPDAPSVCARIVEMRADMQLDGVNPLDLYMDMLDLQRQAEGTAVAPRVDAAVAAMEGFVSGSADTDDVIAAGAALVDSC